jgi:hypothetical protein
MARTDVQRLLAEAEAQADAAARPNRIDIVLRSPINWTVVFFFAALASLHLFMCGHAAWHGRWDGFLSGIFGVAFTLVAITATLVRTELAVIAAERRLRIRTGSRRIFHERSLPFADIRIVRLTLLSARYPQSSTIELVCDREVLDCPPTRIPRQEALCLAMTMGVRLVKVYGDSYGPVTDRVNELTSSEN